MPASKITKLPCPNLWTSNRAPATALPLSTLAASLDRIAPTHLAEDWDNVGLLSGHRTSLVQRVLLSIDLTPAVHDEALRTGTDLLISYHPPIFKPLKHLQLNGNEPPALAVALASYGVWIYSPHTALDTVDGGTNDVLAATVGARVTGSFSHYPAKGTFLKLVAFIPESHVEEVAEAVFAAGAGNIGQQSRYSKCSFRNPGTGTFFGDDNTNPAVGTKGRLERVPEIRFETILPADAAGEVVSALRQSHPYEEPAFDLLRMETPPEQVGLGRYADLAAATTLGAFAHACKAALGLPFAAVAGNPKGKIRTLAIMAGSAGRTALDAHSRKPFDCLLTGELKHHELLAYQAAGVGVILLGHGNSERPVLQYVASRLKKDHPGLSVAVSKADRDPSVIL